VVVVGNLTVGGTGKTPLVIALTQWLCAEGLRPGVVSRGYGGSATEPRRVTVADEASVVGDEPLLIARATGVPVAIGRRRAAAGRLLAGEVDVILCDDGLQHYALRRDLEIAVLDGARQLGNGRLLPAGPLREGPARLGSVDHVVVNGRGGPSGSLHMELVLGEAVQLTDGERRPLAAFAGAPVHAVAGIGHPERFFAALSAAGLAVTGTAFADHAPYLGGEFEFGDGLPVLMTDKDAVKYQPYARAGQWRVEVRAELPPADRERLLAAVRALFSARPRRLPTLE
jgi:tetraacyldisaccharide 4'-kinase